MAGRARITKKGNRLNPKQAASPSGRSTDNGKIEAKVEDLRFLRVELHEAPPLDMDAFAPVFVDLMVKSDHRRAGRGLAFGWRGYPGKRDVECYPFVIDSQGKIDFGSACHSAVDRYGSTDLLSRPIVQGELVKFDFGSEGEAAHRIRRLHDLKHFS